MLHISRENFIEGTKEKLISQLEEKTSLREH